MKLRFDSFYISPIQIQDAWSICDFVIANENRLKRYFPITLSENATPELSHLFVKKKVKEFHAKEEFLFTIKKDNINSLVGIIYLKALDWTHERGELAYCISSPNENKGITTNAVKLLCDYAFEQFNLKTLKIIVHKTNLASIKVAENCNFTWIKTLKKEHTPLGEPPLDMELYELYKDME